MTNYRDGQQAIECNGPQRAHTEPDVVRCESAAVINHIGPNKSPDNHHH